MKKLAVILGLAVTTVAVVSGLDGNVEVAEAGWNFWNWLLHDVFGYPRG